MKFRVLMTCGLLMGGLLAAAALAADAPRPMIVRGTISKIDAGSLTIARADGSAVTAAFLPKTVWSAVEPRSFDQIKPTDFIGVTSVPGPNGTLIAEEIHIIPVQGMGEGSYPWDHHPSNAKAGGSGSMTNATVSGVHGATTAAMMGTVSADHGWQLQVSYRGSAMVDGKCAGLASMATAQSACTGTATVNVTPQTQIVAIVPARQADAKAGLAVFAGIGQTPDGKMVAGSLVLEKNGVKPEF